MSKQVFLSYASSDRPAVLRLAERLKSVGVKVWIDQEQIPPGASIVGKIQQGLRDSDYLVIWLTRNAVDSSWVKNEWETTYYREVSKGSIIVVPLLAEDCELPPFLEGKRYADFRNDFTQGFQELLKAFEPDVPQNTIGMKFVLIPAGTYEMGSTRKNESPPHLVTITKPFQMSVTTVTQGQWKAIMGTEPWKGQRYVQDDGHDDYPAVYVDWHNVKTFITRLNNRERLSKYRLPTEAEWEYAARAGSTTDFCFGNNEGKNEDDLNLYGWYEGNALAAGEMYAHRVADPTFRPNAWGLYDMHGNVWEWVSDWHADYPEGPVIDPEGPTSGTAKVLRGGAWDWGADGARSAFRQVLSPNRADHSIGFRIVREALGADTA